MGTVWLVCVAILQVVSGQVPPFIGQNTINPGQIQQPWPNMNARGLQPPGARANAVPAGNQIARNMANIGHSLPNTKTANMASANLANGNFAGHHFANNRAGTNLDTANYVNSGYANTNLDNLANANFVNANFAHPESPNQIFQSNFANPLTQFDKFNGASSYIAPNTVNSYGNLNFASDVGGMPNPIASSLAGYLASAQADYGNGNIASAVSNLANGVNPSGATFKIGDNPFQVIGESPGNHQLGLHVVADALEVAGTVAVSGKMPIYGTVSLNGNLPTEGKATVNYGCTSQPNV